MPDTLTVRDPNGQPVAYTQLDSDAIHGAYRIVNSDALGYPNGIALLDADCEPCKRLGRRLPRRLR